MGHLAPTPLAVSVGSRDVPTVVWHADRRDAPLVLLGHGGGGHKTAPRQRSLAEQLVAAGMTVLAIDGPAHGDRAARPGMAPGDYQAALVARDFESVVRHMVEDWLAAIEAVRSTDTVGARIGYLGMSMGARFGLPLAAALGERLTCAVLGKFGLTQSPALNPGLHDARQLRADAEKVTAPTMWHVQWDDELFPRDGQLAMFDSLGATDKQLIAFPGKHGRRNDAAVDSWLAFLVRHLQAPLGETRAAV